MPENEVGIRVTADASGFTAAMQRTQQATRETAEQFSRFAKDGAQQSQSFFGKFLQGSESARREMGQMIGSTTKFALQFTLIQGAIDSAVRSFTHLGSTVTGYIKEGVRLNLAAVETGVRLRAIFQSADSATRAMAAFEKVADFTTFSMKDVTAAGTQLAVFLGKNRDQAASLIPVIADLAAFMGTSLPEAATLFGRAFDYGTGAARLLRQTGVLPLIEAFGGIKITTKTTIPEFRAAMMRAFLDPAAGIAGMAEKIGKTVPGEIERMHKAWRSFLKQLTADILPGIGRVAESMMHVFKNAAERLTGTGSFAAAFNVVADTIVKRVPEIENALVRAFSTLGKIADWLSKIDLDKLANIARVVTLGIAGGVGAKVGAAVVGGGAAIAGGVLTAAGTGGALGSLLGPIGTVVGALGGLALGAYAAHKALDKLSEIWQGPEAAQRRTLATLTTLRARILSPIPEAMMPGSTAGVYSVESAERERLRIGRDRNEAIAQLKAITGEQDYAKALVLLDEYISKASISFGSLSKGVDRSAAEMAAAALALAQSEWDAAHVVGKVPEILKVGIEDEIEASRREALLERLAPEAEFSLTIPRVYERARRQPAEEIRPGEPSILSGEPLFETAQETLFRRLDEAHRGALLEQTRQRVYRPTSPQAGTGLTPERGKQFVAEMAYAHAVEETRRELTGTIDLARSLGLGLFEGFQKAGLPLETLQGNLKKVNEVIADAEPPLHAMLKGISENNAKWDQWTLLQEEGRKAAKELRKEWESNVTEINKNILAQNALSRAIMNIQAAFKDASKAIKAGVLDWRAYGTAIAESLMNLAPVGERIKEGAGAVIESISRITAAVSEGAKTSTTEAILAGVRQTAIEIQTARSTITNFTDAIAGKIKSTYQELGTFITDSIVGGLSDSKIFGAIDEMMNYLMFQSIAAELTRVATEPVLKSYAKAFEETDKEKRAEKLRWAQEEMTSATKDLVPEIRNLANEMSINTDATKAATVALNITPAMRTAGGKIIGTDTISNMMAQLAGLGVSIRPNELYEMLSGQRPMSKQVRSLLEKTSAENEQYLPQPTRPAGITVSEITGPTRDLLVALVRGFNAESIVGSLERMISVLLDIKDGVYLLQPLESGPAPQDALVQVAQGTDVDLMLADRRKRRVRLAGTGAA